jgi:hypothetical protein
LDTGQTDRIELQERCTLRTRITLPLLGLGYVPETDFGNICQPFSRHQENGNRLACPLDGETVGGETAHFFGSLRDLR